MGTMSDCLTYSVKLLQLSNAFIIFILFMIPQNLNVFEDAIKDDFPDKPKIDPADLFCLFDKKAFYLQPEDYPGNELLIVNGSGTPRVLLNVTYKVLSDLQKFIYLKDDYHLVNGGHMVKVAKCYKKANETGKKVEKGCFCLGQYYLAVAVIVAVIWIAFSAADSIVMCAFHRRGISRNGCVIVMSTATILTWGSMGGILTYYMFYKWPFVYYKTKKLGDVRRNFFLPPTMYIISIILCYVMAMFAMFECIINAVLISTKEKKERKEEKGGYMAFNSVRSFYDRSISHLKKNRGKPVRGQRVQQSPVRGAYFETSEITTEQDDYTKQSEESMKVSMAGGTKMARTPQKKKQFILLKKSPHTSPTTTSKRGTKSSSPSKSPEKTVTEEDDRYLVVSPKAK